MTILEEYLSYLHENYMFAQSKIHGTGLYADRPFKKGDEIGNATEPSSKDESGFIVTKMGSKINHSWKPNCNFKASEVDGGFRHILRSLQDIKAGEEFTVNYNDYPEFKPANPDWS